MIIPHFPKNALRGNRRVYLFMLATVGLLLFLLPIRAWGNSQGMLTAAYQRLTRLDGYSFVSRIDQTTHPLPTLANVGLSSERSSLLVEGTVKQRTNQAELQISEQNGYLLDGLRQVELRLDEGQVWARAQGQAWQALDPTQALDNAANDPSLLLQAAHNARPLGVEERLGQHFQLIAFDLDGVAWAAVMRQSLQRAMMRRGELAPGTVLERLPYYEGMSGAGTLWVNEQGLPQRLTLHMVYPPLPNESAYREVETITDFRQWQGGDLASRLAGGVTWLVPHSPGEAASTLSMALLLALYLLLPLALLRYRRQRYVYRITFLLLVSLLIGEPLLSTAAVHAADTRRHEHYAAVDATAAETTQIQTAVEEIKANFAANVNRDQAVLPQNALATVAEQDAQQAPAPQDPTADSDGDGLDNATEATLGLDPNDPDSDGDLLSDGFEVTTQIGGKYLDPLNADTNGDEIDDTLECIQAIDVVLDANGQATKSATHGDGSCADTDGDGLPDFADDDNDNDGVMDWMDGQPSGTFGDPTTGVPDDTFAFAVENYTDANPLRITLELRPTNPEHLWYSMNVLDWPSGDYEGQIRRVHDTTLGTTGAAANGDMQLVPMVEITLPAAEAVHLPTQPGTTPLAGDLVGDNARLGEWLDMAVLERYQMAVSWAKDNQTLLVYLPATLIRDKHGNAPVNFVATMLYEPSGAGLFAGVHRARLAWLVQMDHDSCVVPEESSYAESCLPHGADYDKGAHWQTAQRQLVHRYYDSFTVTAFSAEADVSANAQLFYEDPAQINTPATYLPDQLLAFGTLLEGYLRNAQTPTTALAAYQAAQPSLSSRLVAGERLQDADAYGLIAQLATQETPRILDSHFAEQRETVPHPALLYVTWGESNVVGLAGSATGDSVRLDMARAAAKHATTIRLGTFAYEPDPALVGGKQNPHWVAADPSTVWLDYLQGQSAAAYAQLPATAQARFSAADFSQTALGLFWNLA
ncbi:MAG TPA: hypothetical protein P5121_34630, partial [Caldilineaceae bacterium]|nr:hypothetical protein [Caldilineaceae bacterium]